MLCTYTHGLLEMSQISVSLQLDLPAKSINKAVASINFHKAATLESKKKGVEDKMQWQSPACSSCESQS